MKSIVAKAKLYAALTLLAAAYQCTPLAAHEGPPLAALPGAPFGTDQRPPLAAPPGVPVGTPLSCAPPHPDREVACST